MNARKMSPEDIKALAAGYSDDLKAFRRHLHAHPELSWQEAGTAAFIRRELASFGISEEPGHSGNSVVGVLGEAPFKAFRAEIDALPLKEDTGLPFSSLNEGVMHACGHDGHTAVLLVLAKILSEHPELCSEGVKFIFQQAEEHVPGGAKTLVEEGVLDGVSRIFAWHIAPEHAYGSIVTGSGPRSSAVASYYADITGRDGHGAFPQNAVSAVTAGSAAVVAVNELASRYREAGSPAVITVSHFSSGQRGVTNIIPGKARLEGNVRTFSDDLMTSVLDELGRILPEVCAGYGCSCVMSSKRGYPPVVNDADTVSDILPLLGELGYDVHEAPPMPASDDFAYYSMERPAAFLNIGNTDPAVPESSAFVHNPGFILSEGAMSIALEAFLTIYLNT